MLTRGPLTGEIKALLIIGYFGALGAKSADTWKAVQYIM